MNAEIQIPPVARGQAPVTPELIRLPVPGAACPYTGPKRSKMNELLLPCRANNHRPPVKSICLRRPGQKTGVRLVDYASLLNYLRGLGE